MHVSTARLAAFLCVGFAASSLALAAPASANSGTTTLATHNGQVGVNQVLTATYVSSDAGVYCDDEGGVVSFDFKVQNGPNLGTVSGTCTPVSDGSETPVATWTGTMNWTPTKPGAQLLTTQATQQAPEDDKVRFPPRTPREAIRPRRGDAEAGGPRRTHHRAILMAWPQHVPAAARLHCLRRCPKIRQSRPVV